MRRTKPFGIWDELLKEKNKSSTQCYCHIFSQNGMAPSVLILANLMDVNWESFRESGMALAYQSVDLKVFVCETLTEKRSR